MRESRLEVLGICEERAVSVRQGRTQSDRLALNLLDLLGCELDGKRLDVVVEVLDLASAARQMLSA